MMFPLISTLVGSCALVLARSSSTVDCEEEAVRFMLSDPPYTNYFYSDCNSASQVIVTSPLPGNDLELVKPRLLVRLENLYAFSI